MSGSVTAAQHEQQAVQAGLVELTSIDLADLTDVLCELRRLKVSERAIKDRIETFTEAAIGLMDARQQHTVVIDDPAGDGKKVAQVVAGETTTIDLDKLRELAGQAAVDAVAAPIRASVERWEAAVEHNLIPVEVAAQVVTYTPKKPYVSFVNARD